MIPKAISKENWNKVKKLFPELTTQYWKHLDGLKKNNILKECGVFLNCTAIFGENYILNYPDDLYSKRKTILNENTLNEIKKMVKLKKEVGGIINNNVVEFLFTGDETKIKLDLQKKADTLFHTHPEDPEVKYDPPSVLDIISFLALNVHSIAEFISVSYTHLTLPTILLV